MGERDHSVGREATELAWSNEVVLKIPKHGTTFSGYVVGLGIAVGAPVFFASLGVVLAPRDWIQISSIMLGLWTTLVVVTEFFSPRVIIGRTRGTSIVLPGLKSDDPDLVAGFRLNGSETIKSVGSEVVIAAGPLTVRCPTEHSRHANALVRFLSKVPKAGPPELDFALMPASWCQENLWDIDKLNTDAGPFRSEPRGYRATLRKRPLQRPPVEVLVPHGTELTVRRKATTDYEVLTETGRVITTALSWDEASSLVLMVENLSANGEAL